MQTDMHKELKKEIHRYLNDIKYLMPGDVGSKRKYLRGFKEQIYDFAAENGIASMRDIILHFGEKEEVARLYTDTLDYKLIKRKMKIKRTVAVLLVSALVVWGVAAAAGSVVSKTEEKNWHVVLTQINEGVWNENC